MCICRRVGSEYINILKISSSAGKTFWKKENIMILMRQKAPTFYITSLFAWISLLIHAFIPMLVLPMHVSKIRKLTVLVKFHIKYFRPVIFVSNLLSEMCVEQLPFCAFLCQRTRLLRMLLRQLLTLSSWLMLPNQSQACAVVLMETITSSRDRLFFSPFSERKHSQNHSAAISRSSPCQSRLTRK